jgi:AcrR family transcriptional regulator
VSEQSRRAQKKALTRAHVRETAQRLFAERGFEAVTIADVATAADVAVQTVFNHFATKDELFWSDRTPWVDSPALAVRERPRGVPALAALREHLVEAVGSYLEGLATETGRRMVGTLAASPALQAAERELHFECEGRLRAALADAWADPAPGEPVPPSPRTTAGLVAATWLATTRVLVTDPREALPPAEEIAAQADAARRLARRLLGRYEADLTEHVLDSGVETRRAS